MSRATELTEGLRQFGARPAGSDPERRAAMWTAEQIRTDPRRTAELQTFWSRPNWVLAQTWHMALAVAGSLLSSTQSTPGAAMILAALIFLVADWTTGRSPGRLLTRERASQNVVSTSSRTPRVRLILTAYLDTSRLNTDRALPFAGWLFWAAGATVLTLIAALLRVEGSRSAGVVILQLIPTVALILGAAWLLLIRRSDDDAEGVASALALTRLLDAAPPAHLGIDLVLTGAGAGDGLGLRRYLRAERRRRDAPSTVVLGIGPGPGAYFLSSDGPLLPASFFAPLRNLARQTGAFTARGGTGCSPALPARMRHLPSLSIGGEPDAVVAAALDLVDLIDTYVGALAPQASGDPRPRRFRRG